ncbi:hypothetical protein PCO31110_03970 [Pandoraea communis]|uniref:Uncharacterized protein n=1 Tax=Pandoraea communis TaxID=2508297 RepID=A0A5E4XJX4_9BURK|nr:hypothetical protein PCO31110_03970 [Pandoraea communis]
MKKRSELMVLALLTWYSTIFLSILGFFTRLLVAAYFAINKGVFHFDISDFVLSAKAGAMAGVTLGVGLWALDKIKKYESNNRT